MGKSQSPWPSLAAGGCHTAAPSAISSARTRRETRKAPKKRKSSHPNPVPQRQRAAQEARRPAASNP